MLFNGAAERIFGYSAGEVVGRNVNQLMAEPYAAEHDEYIARYERTGEAHAIGRIRTVTGGRRSGELFPLELSVTEVEVDDDVHHAAFLRGISQTVDLHVRAVENEWLSAIGSTAARIGHEIANPLNGIYLTLQLVEQRLAKAAFGGRARRDGHCSGRKGDRPTESIGSGVSHSIESQQPYRFHATPLPELIEDVVELQEPLFAARGIKIERRIAPGLPPVSLDEDKIKQALVNLVKNAAEAMLQGGTLSICVAAEHDEMVIGIADTGYGIPPEADVFAPFYTTKEEGTGLGLFIVRQILSAHAGAISYDSQLGRGTKFRITLPLKSGLRPDLPGSMKNDSFFGSAIAKLQTIGCFYKPVTKIFPCMGKFQILFRMPANRGRRTPK